jgi:hypothetical protein
MDPNFWQRYAVGGATRPDSFTGMNPQFRSSLERMFTEAPPDIQSQLQVYSGYRSPERQAELWKNALAKYGSPAAARKWVAPPGNSKHNLGFASDLRFGSDAARQWAHANAAKYGLAFPLSNENWHIELMGARGQKQDRGLAALVARRPGDATVNNVQAQETAAVVPQARPMPQPEPGLASLYPQQANVPAQMPASPFEAGLQATQTAGLPPAGDASVPGLALMFMQSQAAKRKQRDEEREAEEIRRAALLGGINPYS